VRGPAPPGKRTPTRARSAPGGSASAGFSNGTIGWLNCGSRVAGPASARYSPVTSGSDSRTYNSRYAAPDVDCGVTPHARVVFRGRAVLNSGSSMYRDTVGTFSSAIRNTPGRPDSSSSPVSGRSDGSWLGSGSGTSALSGVACSPASAASCGLSPVAAESPSTAPSVSVPASPSSCVSAGAGSSSTAAAGRFSAPIACTMARSRRGSASRISSSSRTIMNCKNAVLSTIALARTGSSMPASSTTIRSSPSLCTVGSLTPNSSIRLRIVVRVRSIASLLESSVSVPSGSSISTARYIPPRRSSPRLIAGIFSPFGPSFGTRAQMHMARRAMITRNRFRIARMDYEPG